MGTGKYSVGTVWQTLHQHMKVVRQPPTCSSSNGPVGWIELQSIWNSELLNLNLFCPARPAGPCTNVIHVICWVTVGITRRLVQPMHTEKEPRWVCWMTQWRAVTFGREIWTGCPPDNNCSNNYTTTAGYHREMKWSLSTKTGHSFLQINHRLKSSTDYLVNIITSVNRMRLCL